MSSKDQEALSEIRVVHSKMDELQKAATTARSSFTARERALAKAQEKLDEARASLVEADAAVAAHAPEMRKAANKMVNLMAKDPALMQEFLSKAIGISSGQDA